MSHLLFISKVLVAVEWIYKSFTAISNHSTFLSYIWTAFGFWWKRNMRKNAQQWFIQNRKKTLCLIIIRPQDFCLTVLVCGLLTALIF